MIAMEIEWRRPDVTPGKPIRLVRSPEDVRAAVRPWLDVADPRTQA